MEAVNSDKGEGLLGLFKEWRAYECGKSEESGSGTRTKEFTKFYKRIAAKSTITYASLRILKTDLILRNHYMSNKPY
jgi:hypothetical protein